MRCKKCNSTLAPHDLWCSSCGRQTPAVTSDLSALASLARTWKSFKQYKGGNVPAAAFSIILGIIPVAVLMVIFHSFGLLDLAEITNTPKLLLNLLIVSFSVGVFIPFILMPFQPVTKTDNYTIGFADMEKAMSAYPRYLLFSLFSALYFVVIYLICSCVDGTQTAQLLGRIPGFLQVFPRRAVEYLPACPCAHHPEPGRFYVNTCSPCHYRSTQLVCHQGLHRSAFGF